MMVARIRKFLLLVALAACAMPSVRADEAFCVSDFADLQSALAEWAVAPDGAAVTIRLVRGNYDFDSASGDTLGIVQATHAASLKFLGGYAAGCVEGERVLDPRNTVIDGHGENSSRFELIGINADALIEGITFTRLDDGVEMHHDPSLPSLGHTLAIEQSRIVGNLHQSGGGAYSVRLLGVGSGNSGADLAIRNCVIADNDNGGFVIGFGDLSTGSGGSIALTNSTIANNIARAGFVLQGFSGMTGIAFDVTDDIAWHNGTNASYQDLDVSNAPEPPSVTYSLVGVIVGTIGQTTTNMANDPRFLAQGDGNYRLNVGSPALDSGAPAQLYGFPSQDLDGRARVLGIAIDRGAYEAVPGDLIFFSSFNAVQ